MRVYPQLKMNYPIAVARQPDSERLLYITQPWQYAQTTIHRTTGDPATGESEVLLKLDGVAYDIAFHPQFAKNGYVYIGSNGRVSPDGRVPEDGRKRTRITRYPYFVSGQLVGAHRLGRPHLGDLRAVLLGVDVDTPHDAAQHHDLLLAVDGDLTPPLDPKIPVGEHLRHDRGNSPCQCAFTIGSAFPTKLVVGAGVDSHSTSGFITEPDSWYSDIAHRAADKTVLNRRLPLSGRVG